MGKKKKKPFVDKKKSVRFHLVHRDQKDPLQADSDAPEMVLHAVEGSQEEERKKFGIFFDDDYDYLQHLKPRGDGVLVMADDHKPSSSSSSSSKNSMFKDVGGIQLPKEVLPSEFEEEEGMLGKGVLPRGPQPEWDPDIVEALDDGLDLDDPSNQLDDDFVMLANGEGDIGSEDGSSGGYSDRDFSSDDLNSDDESFDKFGFEETKSHFTNYSMTSSVIRRTQGLQQLDDRFEKVMEEYDDDLIGELSENDDGGDRVGEEEKTLMEKAMGELDVKYDISNVDSGKVEHALVVHSDDNDEGEEFEKYTEPEKEKWDCESIISTYSNIYNHPKLITEPKPIKLTKRLGIPTNILKKNNKGGDLDINAPIEMDITVSGNMRKKNETKEEKRDRKNAIKEERRSRRFEKKANKLAFKNEQKVQERILASQPMKPTISM